MISGRIWTANELDAREDIDAAGQEHGEAANAELAISAGARGRVVPGVKVLAPRLVVHVVKETVLGHQKSIALERTRCKAKS